MRKRLITQKPQDSSPNEDWLDLESAAVVEVTSEQKGYPIESALVLGETQGWRASDSGTQTIRLVFDVPQRIRRIWLVFEETEAERTHEFVLRWFSMAGTHFEKLCASSGTSARQTQHARPRTIESNSRM
jgi:hypothetical protein